jgi:two-component system KDP operon response regulator KdpE
MLHLGKRLFSGAGAEIYVASDGQEGLGRFGMCEPDLVLLDVRMPVLDGWQTCRLIRRLSDVPIIFVTCLTKEEDIVRGLDCGAVDYVTKPFSPEVLLARARAALRMAEAGSKRRRLTQYRDDYLEVDLEARRVRVEGRLVQLTGTEYRLLAYLFVNAGRVVTYDQILERVWGLDCHGSDEYVHVYVWHLRQKLEQDPRHSRYVLTEHGVGYRFEVNCAASNGWAA